MNAFEICAGLECELDSENLIYLNNHYLIPYVIGLNSSYFDEFYVKRTLVECKLNYFRSIKMLSLFIASLENQKINYCILKGISISETYSMPHTRLMGDHDVLVRRCDYKRVEKILVELGYFQIAETEHDKSFASQNPNVVHKIELHFKLFDDYMISFNNKLIESIWDNITSINSNGYQFIVPNPNWQFKYLILHALKHLNGTGFGIRYIVDIVNYANYYHIDFEHYDEYFIELGFYEFYRTIVSLCFRYFKMLSANPIWLDSVDTETINWLEKYILESGLHGHADLTRNMTLIYENYVKDLDNKGSNILHWIFPKVEVLKPKYSYADKNKMFLLIAWFHRWFSIIFRKDLRMNQKLILFTKDKKMLKKREEMFKKFGLR